MDSRYCRGIVTVRTTGLKPKIYNKTLFSRRTLYRLRSLPRPLQVPFESYRTQFFVPPRGPKYSSRTSPRVDQCEPCRLIVLLVIEVNNIT